MGIAVTGIIAILLGKREGLDPRKLAHVLLITAVSILIGGRIMYVLIYPSEFQGRWSDAVDLTQSGQVHYGGVIFGILGGIYALKKMRLPVGRVLDVFAVGAPLGVLIGRLGCFCRGCCFGSITDVPWAVRYPPFVDIDGNLVGSPAFLYHVETAGLAKSAAFSLPVHPSQLYEAGAECVVFGIMLWLWKSRCCSGRLLLVYVALYCAVRFLVEFTRVERIAFYGLSIYQVISIVILICALIAWHVLPQGRPSVTETGQRLPKQMK
jgi:phosphatidylglycerol:prolipoprotein diacylglycerol transferase